jgi:chorismate synthase
MNTFGKIFQVTLYGESHQDAIGVVIDGVIPGTIINENLIHEHLALRRPGAIGTTARQELDAFKITSGVFLGRATGSPVHLIIENKDVISKDYEHLKTHPRPGNADFVAMKKYQGFHDYRGGGRFSGRLTAALVAAGSIAKMMIPYSMHHELVSLGTCKDPSKFDAYVTAIGQEGDSVGGMITLTIQGIPVGLGEPMFYKLDATITQLLMSIPAVKLVSFGNTLELLEAKGSVFNDVIINDQGTTKTNHSGGITGGISNGNPIVIHVFIKPTSSIQKVQETYHFEDHSVEPLKASGRHDVAIARRAGIVIENTVACVLADMYLLQRMYDTKH